MTNIEDVITEDSTLSEHLKWNAYFSSENKLLYVATPKVACTSIKWWFSTLEGVSQEILCSIDSNETDPDLVIHDTFFKVAPDVTDLSIGDLQEALSSDEYFKFAVVRNPFKRIFSAWQSKLLLREPLQIGPYVNRDFMSLPIDSPADIKQAFEAFLVYLDELEAPYFLDAHWTPQTTLLRPDLISYSAISKIEDTAVLERALRTHLGGRYVSPFSVKRANESLIPYRPEFISDKAASLIRHLYKSDFYTFDYATTLPEASAEFTNDQLSVAIAAIKMLRGRHKRISEMRDVLGSKIAERDGQIAGVNQTIADRDVQVASLNQDIAERDGQIATLNQAIADRDAQIASLNQDIADRGGQVASLNQGIAERDGQIASLNQGIAERDGQLVELSSHILLIMRSKSWLITKPLRFLSRTVKHAGLGNHDREHVLTQLRSLYRRLPIPFETKNSLRKLFFRVTGWSTHTPPLQGVEMKSIANAIQTSRFHSELGTQVEAGEGTRQIKPYFGVRRPHGKRRAAILTNQLLDWHDGRPRFGGGERYALELARLLRDLSIEVTFFQPSSQSTGGDYYSFEVRLLQVGYSVGEFQIGVCSKFTEISSDFDHVYYHLPEYASGDVREDGLMTCHGIWFDHNNYPGSIFRTPAWFEQLYRAFRNPSSVISVDTNSIGVIRSLWPELAQKMHFIPNFYDGKLYYPDATKRNPERLTILFPRRSQINRGSRIFPDIVNKIPYDISIIWLGEGDPVDTQIIKDVCAQDKRVSFCVADFDQMPIWYQKADIAVIPTIACEGTSLSCIEALACGCAVIATNVGGLPDVVYDGLNGLLVDPEPNDIANAINRLIENHALRERLQQQGAKTAVNFELKMWRARWAAKLLEHGWVDDETSNRWFRENAADALVTHPTKPEKWIILTRNAIHGGVESLIREESKILDAPVVVCGGHDKRDTCPFEYSRADNARSLSKAIDAYDVILYHWLPDWALEVIRKSNKTSIEFVHRTDTSASDKSIPKALVTHSAFLAKYIYETHGKLCRVVDHPIALDHFVPEAQLGNCIGAITSYYETKGIDIFLRSWALLKDEFGHFPVRFYGAGDDLHKFRKLAAELGIDADFREATTEPWKVMREFQCFVVPSRIEGLPVAILEALAMNIPVVASALPGMIEFNELSERRGYDSYVNLALPENPGDLANILRNVLGKRERKNSNEYIRDYYSPQKHCSDLVSVLREVSRH